MCENNEKQQARCENNGKKQARCFPAQRYDTWHSSIG